MIIEGSTHVTLDFFMRNYKNKFALSYSLENFIEENELYMCCLVKPIAHVPRHYHQ